MHRDALESRCQAASADALELTQQLNDVARDNLKYIESARATEAEVWVVASPE